jgi:putative endonuclease
MELFYIMPNCYILYSGSLQKYYVGATQDLVNRLEKHHSGDYGSEHYTAKAKDWVLFLEIQVSNMAHAIRLERKIKRMKSSRYIENLKKYPELFEKIVTETSCV